MGTSTPLKCTSNPNMRQPSKLVPILSNVSYDAWGPHHHTGGDIHPLIAVCWQLAGGVDSADQMMLQMRLLGRKMCRSQAVRGFVLRYPAAKVFTTCRALEGCSGMDSMLQWQSCLVVRYEFSDAHLSNTHVPMGRAQRSRYAACGKGCVQRVPRLLCTRAWHHPARHR